MINCIYTSLSKAEKIKLKITTQHITFYFFQQQTTNQLTNFLTNEESEQESRA